jgi:hypothetical protein
MVFLRRVAELDVSAASGLVLHDQLLHVVADDELTLHSYDLQGRPVRVTRLFSGELPPGPRERKAAKPDLEGLTRLSDGSLLALGSGSTLNRQRGVLLPAGGPPKEVDAAPLFERLRERLPRLNVEGLTAWRDELVLFNRGNGKRGQNALVRLDGAEVARSLGAARPCLTGEALRSVVSVQLGSLASVPLGFTDASALRDGIVFSAAAEDTDDPVADGACGGSVLGWIAREVLEESRRRSALEPTQLLGLSEPVKVEGIAVAPGGVLYAVADADDRAQAAPLLSGELPPDWH